MHARIKKIANRLLFKFYIKKHEKVYSRQGHLLRYLLIESKKAQCDTLLVSFSGFAPKGSKPTYNYIRTLRNCDVNKVYLLDDFGLNSSGSYYLGEDGDFFLLNMIPDLLSQIKELQGIKKMVFFGSSKGATSALLYGILMGVDQVILGSPQYYIGDYLSENQYHQQILRKITGSISEDSKKTLNKMLPDLIASKRFSKLPDVYMHYSINESSYNHHLKNLINDLVSNNYTLYEDRGEYLEHSDVAIHFPRYLITTIKHLLTEE